MKSVERVPIDDDAPMTLAEACTIVFRDLIKPGILRAEARRGRLIIERIGRRDFVTRAALKEMRELCRTPRATLAGIDQAKSDPSRARRSVEAALASAVALRQSSKPAVQSKLVAQRVRSKSDVLAVVNPLAKTRCRKPKASRAKFHDDVPAA